MYMKIREGKLKDISNIEKIYLKGVIDEGRLQFSGEKLKEFKEDIKKFKKKRLEEFKKDIRSTLTHMVIAEEEEIIGFGVANVNKENKKFGATPMIYVKKEFRGKNVASKIKKELLKWLKIKKVKYVSTGMFIKNKPSIALNKKFGFEIVAVRMQKDLK